MSGREHQMTKKRKHSKAEIAFKLAEADDLVTQGKLQSEIARARRERHDPASLAQAAVTVEWFEPNRSEAANQNCRTPTRKFTAAAIGDRSAPRTDETRRRLAARAHPLSSARDRVGQGRSACEPAAVRRRHRRCKRLGGAQAQECARAHNHSPRLYPRERRGG